MLVSSTSSLEGTVSSMTGPELYITTRDPPARHESQTAELSTEPEP